MANLSLRTRRLLARGLSRRQIRSIGGHYFYGLGNRATLTTALAGANNDVTLTAKTPGVAGNSIRFAIAVAGNNTPLSVTVAGSDITVNSATNGAGAATSTARDVRRIIDFDRAAGPLVWAQDAPQSDGTGVVAALALTNLSGAV